MRKTLRVNPKTHLVCVPQELVEDGMVGDVIAFANVTTLTIVSPSATLEDVRTSLTTVLRDIEQRIELAKRKSESC